MTKIIFYKNNNNYVGFEVDGHTGFAEFGADILCASVSSISQTAILGIKSILKKNNYKVTIKENVGYLKLEILKLESSDLIQKSDLILKTAFLGLKDLSEGYSSYIKIEEKKYVY